MDPITLAALISGGATLAASIPEMRKTELEKEQERRLKDLQRRQELGALGLTDAERSQITSQFAGQQAQAQAQQKALLGQYAGLQGQPAAQALAGVASGEAARNLAAQQAQALTAADFQKREQEKQDILDLTAAQTQMKKDRQAAMMAPIEAAGSAALQAYTMNQLLGLSPQQQQAIGYQGQATNVPVKLPQSEIFEQKISDYQKQYGLSRPEALRLYAEFDATDEKYLGLLGE